MTAGLQHTSETPKTVAANTHRTSAILLSGQDVNHVHVTICPPLFSPYCIVGTYQLCQLLTDITCHNLLSDGMLDNAITAATVATATASAAVPLPL